MKVALRVVAVLVLVAVAAGADFLLVSALGGGPAVAISSVARWV